MARLELNVPDGKAEDEIEIVEINVSTGTAVSAGDVLLEVATDKANFDLVAPTNATVIEVRVAAGDLTTGDAILVVLEAK